ncbi:MAG: tRNA pseudouridine(55) synthase TruB [Candidatus Omnitrophica bacterium]|nr:tRNA pseudouridine(55) synthase TruB [Candidatus Omnitrophota bacterium]
MDNVLIIDKPSGMTSHDAVDFIRRKLKIKKVGHCGTLDPMATGVLVILLDKATKLSAKLSCSDKEYICTMELGKATDTQDATGKIIDRAETSGISRDTIEEVILSFKGKQKQVPPMVSAKHYKGKRLYSLARKGIEVEREPKDIEIKDIEIIEIEVPLARFRVSCSKGTYIRTLCHDIGKKLGCGAHMVNLNRIRSGEFHIKDAIQLSSL